MSFCKVCLGQLLQRLCVYINKCHAAAVFKNKVLVLSLKKVSTNKMLLVGLKEVPSHWLPSVYFQLNRVAEERAGADIKVIGVRVTQYRIYQNYRNALLMWWFSHNTTESVIDKFLQSVGFVTTTGCGSALIKIKLNVHYVHPVGGFFQCQRKHCLFLFEEIQHLLRRNENRNFLNYWKIINQMASLLILKLCGTHWRNVFRH